MNDYKKHLIKLWNINICPLKLDGFIEIIHSHIKKRNNMPLHITGVNPETMAHAYKNCEMYDAIKSSDLINIENHFVLLVLRILGYKIPERVATPNLMNAMLTLAEKNKYTIYILGASESVLTSALNNIKMQYPSLIISGYKNGYYTQDQEPVIVSEIKSKRPDMLFVALPSPKKEIFIANYKNVLNVPVLLGVGGAIDVKAGLVKRAPVFLQNIGLEGIHRSLQNPMNYGKRYFTLYPTFIRLVIHDFLSK
jgi:N-acetylglucosaminyldiphosphoundecaprenol N-acetyl-beta-D-mannosaminyltransferase